MNFIKKLFTQKNTKPSKTTVSAAELKSGGNDLDENNEDGLEEVAATTVGAPTGEATPKKKPGRPKGSTAKKTPSKKTPSKKV